MSDSKLGENGIQLQNDEKREALADTLDELRRRLSPGAVRASAMATVREHPVPFAIAAGTAVVGTASAIVLRVRSGRRG